MTSKVLNTPSLSMQRLTVQEVRGRLQDKSVEVLTEIVKDNTRRMEGFTEDSQLLTNGIFYPADYFEALKKAAKSSLSEYLRNTNAFFHGYTSPRHFDLVNDRLSPSGKKVACFVLKNGVLPSEALHAMKNGLSLLGCGEVCQIAQYAAVEDVLGVEKFNALFSSDSPTPLMIGARVPENPIARLRLYLMQVDPPQAQIQKGDQVFIQNVNTYPFKHVLSHAQAFNVLCLNATPGCQKFTGLGLPPEGLPHDHINEVLLGEFNLPQNSWERLSSTCKEICEKIFKKHLLKAVELKDTQLTPESFKAEGGGILQIVCALDAERITALANSTLAEARKLLDGYDVEVRTRN